MLSDMYKLPDDICCWKFHINTMYTKFLAPVKTLTTMNKKPKHQVYKLLTTKSLSLTSKSQPAQAKSALLNDMQTNRWLVPVAVDFLLTALQRVFPGQHTMYCCHYTSVSRESLGLIQIVRKKSSTGRF